MRHVVVFIFLIMFITACGKKGPLIYPEMLMPAAPLNVSLQQVGNSMKLAFSPPSKDLAGRTLSGVSGITIVRRDEPVGQSPGCSSCTTDFAPFRKLNLDLLPPDTRRYGNLLVVLDGDVQPGRAYSYLLSAVTKENLESKFSAPIMAVMVAAPLPPVLQAISQPTEIHLEFVGIPPLEGVIAGYNVYRSVKGEAFSFLPLNREPLTANRFVDVGLERGVSYVYGVRSVVLLPSGTNAESVLSNEVAARLKDDE